MSHSGSSTPVSTLSTATASSERPRRAVKKSDKVRILMGSNKDQIGTVMFIGETQFATGKWLGIALETPDGKNDGSVKDIRYFECTDKHGLFVKPSMVRPLDDESAPVSGDVTPIQPTPAPSLQAQLQTKLAAVTSARTPATTATTTTTATKPSTTSSTTTSAVKRTTTTGAASTATGSATSRTAAATRPTSATSTVGAKRPTSTTTTPARPTATARTTTTSKANMTPRTQAAAKPATQPAAVAAKTSAPHHDDDDDEVPDESLDDVDITQDMLDDDDDETKDEDASPLKDKQSVLAALQQKKRDMQGDSSIVNAAAEAHKKAQIEAKKQQQKQAKDEQASLDNSLKELEKTKAELADVKAKLKSAQQSYIDTKKIADKVPKLEEKNAELSDLVENSSLEKEIAEQQVEELKDEVEMLKESLKNAQLEAEMVKQQSEAQAQEMLRNLPTNEQETAKIVQQNKTLADALRQLRDLSMAEKQRFDLTIEQQKKTIVKLQADSNQLKDAQKALAKATSDVKELEEAVEEAESYREMVEELSEKNENLAMKILDFEEQIAQLKELNEAADEVELGHQDFEKQLQSELDAAHAEISLLTQKNKVNEVKLKDMKKNLQQFRSLVEQLQPLANSDRPADNGVTLGQSSGGSVAQQEVMSRMLKLQTQVTELRAQSVDFSLYQLQAQQAKFELSFVKNYIPTKFKIDEKSLHAIQLLERFEFKTSLIASLMERFYGAEAIIVDAEDNTSGIKTFINLCVRACLMCVDVQSVVSCIKRSLFKAEGDNYTMAISRLKALSPCESQLDEFLKLIRQDSITDITPLTPLDQAYTTLQEYLVSFFGGDGIGNIKSDPSALPRADTDTALELSCKRVWWRQAATRVHIRHLGSLLAQVDVKEDEDASLGLTTSAVQLFSQFEDEQIKVQTAAANLVVYSRHLREKDNYVHDNNLDKELVTVDKISTQTLERVSELVLSTRSTIARLGINNTAALQPALLKLYQDSLGTQIQAPGSLRHAVDGVGQHITRLTTMVEDRLMTASRGNPLERKDAMIPLWQKQASEIREELDQAAGLKSKLDESAEQLQNKVNELNTVQANLREHQKKIYVLQERLKLVEAQAGTSTEVSAEYEKVKRKFLESQEAVAQLQQDLTKYTQENAAFKKQIARLSLNKVDKSKPAANTTVNVVSGELELMAHTVRSLRARLSSANSRLAHQENLALSLAPLPDLKATRLFVPSHHSLTNNLALTSLRERVKMNNSATEKMERLREDLQRTSKQLLDLRAAPVLVDLSRPSASSSSSSLHADLTGADVGQSWHVQQQRKLKLQAQCLKLKKTMYNALRKTATDGSAGVGSGLSTAASQPVLVGRVKMPATTHHASTVPVEVDHTQLLQLYSNFVPIHA